MLSKTLSVSVTASRVFARGLTSIATGIDHDLFNPNHFKDTFKPMGEALTPQGWVYHSEAWHKRELETVWRPGWLLVGREDELPEPGSYLTINAPGVGPVLVIRQRDMSIRAFANICRHRGAVLLREPKGQIKGGITCPYHAWVFAPDGTLRGAPKTKDGPSCFDKKKWPLLDIRMESYAGFLFVNGSDDAPSLGEYMGNCPETLLDKWNFEDFVTVGRKEYEVECNYKLLQQNTSETYHTATVHKSSLGAMPSSSVTEATGVEPVGDWDAVYVPTDRSVVPLPGEPAPFPSIASETFFVNLFPALQLNITHDCAWWMRLTPTSPTSTTVTQGFMFPKSTVEMDGFEELLEPYLYRWELAVKEDNEISLNQQDGVSSALYRPGPYVSLEFATLKYDQHMLHKVLAGSTIDWTRTSP